MFTHLYNNKYKIWFSIPFKSSSWTSYPRDMKNHRKPRKMSVLRNTLLELSWKISDKQFKFHCTFSFEIPFRANVFRIVQENPCHSFLEWLISGNTHLYPSSGEQPSEGGVKKRHLQIYAYRIHECMVRLYPSSLEQPSEGGVKKEIPSNTTLKKVLVKVN